MTSANDRRRTDSLDDTEQSASQRLARESGEGTSTASSATGAPVVTASDASETRQPTNTSQTEQRFGGPATTPVDASLAAESEARDANRTVVDASSQLDSGVANLDRSNDRVADASDRDGNTAAEEPGSGAGTTSGGAGTIVGALAEPAHGDANGSNLSGETLGATEEGRIVLRATSESWIQVRDGETGQPLFTGLLESGDVYRVPSVPGLRLTAGNAGGLQVMVDGQVAPSLGGDVWCAAMSFWKPIGCVWAPWRESERSEESRGRCADGFEPLSWASL